MTTLPEKNLLSGNKLPRTTTGEMKEALGKLRDYLAELLGEDSSDKETARQALGIDLMQWAEKIEAKADPKDIESAIATKADKTELESRVLELEDAIAKRGIPVGSIEYFATTVPPAGYLKADGAAVGRETYPDLFAAIGTTFGEGDGETTFNLPDLIDRFAQGSNTPGQRVEAGLPNITGAFASGANSIVDSSASGAFVGSTNNSDRAGGNSTAKMTIDYFNAACSNPIYGASNTVQPPALTLLPCIKAFDAATNPGLIDVTELASDVSGLSANKLDKAINGTTVKYVTETYNDGTNWYRKWSDGWLEQGGMLVAKTGIITLTFLLPFADDKYCILKNTGSTVNNGYPSSAAVSFYNLTTTSALTPQVDVYTFARWYACGQRA